MRTNLLGHTIAANAEGAWLLACIFTSIPNACGRCVLHMGKHCNLMQCNANMSHKQYRSSLSLGQQLRWSLQLLSFHLPPFLCGRRLPVPSHDVVLPFDGGAQITVLGLLHCLVIACHAHDSSYRMDPVPLNSCSSS